MALALAKLRRRRHAQLAIEYGFDHVEEKRGADKRATQCDAHTHDGIDRGHFVLRRLLHARCSTRHACVCSVVCRDTSPTCEYTQAKFRGEAKPPRRFLGANGPMPFAPDGPPGRADESANPGVTT